YVLLLHDGDVFVGVGSDHTDRALEGANIGKSKQVCKNVVSARVWRHRDVAPVWDELELRSWVRLPESTQQTLYQQGALSTSLPSDELLAMVQSRIKDKDCEGLVIFSGTVPMVAGTIIYSNEFRCELFDPRSRRSLACGYKITPLQYLDGAEE